MRNYGQYCPIARGSGILAERWTPIILRNVLLGCRTFNEIAAGAPGLSRALLTKRLRELEQAGVVEIQAKPNGRGSLYHPTAAGRELWPVLQSLGDWAERWMDVTAEHADPDLVLWSWCTSFLRRDVLPARRVVVRFEFRHGGRRARLWLLVERQDGELCTFDPGFGDDVVVTVADPLVFARWHLGLVYWSAALRSGAIAVEGPRELCRALPTWNAYPEVRTAGEPSTSASPAGGSLAYGQRQGSTPPPWRSVCHTRGSVANPRKSGETPGSAHRRSERRSRQPWRNREYINPSAQAWRRAGPAPNRAHCGHGK